MTRYYTLSECCCPKFAVLFLWGALSDERTQSESGVTLRLTVSQSVSQSVLASSPLCGSLAKYGFLFNCLGLKFLVFSKWGALSDERPGLSIVRVRDRVRVTLRQSVGQAVGMSWHRAHFVDVWPDNASFSTVCVWIMYFMLDNINIICWAENGARAWWKWEERSGL
jgi:hypothetical protein